MSNLNLSTAAPIRGSGARFWDVFAKFIKIHAGFRYDASDRISRMIETRTNSVLVWDYEYDLAGQLIAATQRDGNGSVLHRYGYTYDAAGNRTSEQIDTAVASEYANQANQITDKLGGGHVRISGFLSETGTVSIAGFPAQMTTSTNFVGDFYAAVGTNVFDVAATDSSGNATTNWFQLPITANGLDNRVLEGI